MTLALMARTAPVRAAVGQSLAATDAG